MLRPLLTALVALTTLLAAPASAAGAETLRAAPANDRLSAPATPLVACDPYFSIWSPADRLTDADTTHWTGKPHRLQSVARIDGKAYRVLGAAPASVPALTQTGVEVLPTRTVCTFEDAGILLTLTFMTAALPEDIDLLSRPVTYVTYEIRATDGRSHTAEFEFGASGELCVNTPNQLVTGAIPQVAGLSVVRAGSRDQAILARKGDDLRIDWGYLYLAAPSGHTAGQSLGSPTAATEAFIAGKSQPASSGPSEPVPGGSLQLSLTLRPVTVEAKAVTRWLMLAYDDLYSIQYNHKNLRPYWRREGREAEHLLKAAASDYPSLVRRCKAFDEELMADLTRAGGAHYARIAALAFRQCFAAGKFVADENGQPLQFCKENHSNGCIATSDVFYPMAPQFLLFGPSVAKSFIVPFLNYAASDRWKFPFAPHDLGTYPHANGQVYGGGERTEENQMPVEESGNLLLLVAAVAQMEGNADFASRYWTRLTQWAGYLKTKGFDPENQLCTDDFAGHLAHNVNLSAKAICGLGAYAKLCAMRGDSAAASEYLGLAREFASRWVTTAEDGDHFRLAFDRPGTWSQKYNLIWDRILDLNLFPRSVARKEMDFYKRTQNRFGLPLDNRETYTKLDWILWTATLTQDRADFESLVDPVYAFLNQAPDRSPMTDWYQTKSARKVGFTARPVVGGVFAQMLYDRQTWRKYASRDETRARSWAPMPHYVPPTLVPVITSARNSPPPTWHYTTSRPAEGWQKPGFDAAAWKDGAAGFGTRGTPGALVHTEWNTADIWMRREVNLPAVPKGDLALDLHHDEDAEVFINGIPVASANGYTSDYEAIPLGAAAREALHEGGNVIAVHCHQTGGGQYIDLGLVEIRPAKR